MTNTDTSGWANYTDTSNNAWFLNKDKHLYGEREMMKVRQDRLVSQMEEHRRKLENELKQEDWGVF